MRLALGWVALLAVVQLVSVPSVVGTCANQDELENVNGDNFFNKCFMDVPPGFGTVFAQTVTYWLNPSLTGIVLVFIIAVSPFLILTEKRSSRAPAVTQYKLVQLHLLNFLHRVVVSNWMSVVLYTIFRQHRPCRCDGEQVGSIYGMPSGDAMVGGVVGAYFLDQAPLHPIWSRLFGLTVIIFKAAERVLFGFHSIGQVTTGLTIGVLYNFYSTRLPQYVVFIDLSLQFVSGLIFMNIDQSLNYQDFNPLNIKSWYFQGATFGLFVALMLGRFYWKRFNGETRKVALRLSLYHPANMPATVSVADAQTPFLDADSGDSAATPQKLFVVDSDFNFTIFACLCTFLASLFAQSVEGFAI